MAQLFEAMQKEVDAFVEHYQTDFTIHDTKYLLERAKPGEVYYWLIRESGTQLYNQKDLIIENEDWNERDLLFYFKDYKKKFFELTITSNNGDSLDGEIKKLNYDKFCKELKQNLKTPSQLKVSFKDEVHIYDWSTVGKPSKFLDDLTAYLKEPMDWSKIDYEFIFN